LAFSIHGIQDKPRKDMFLGAVLKLREIANGNANVVATQTLNEVLDNHLEIFTRHMPPQERFSVASAPSEMRRGAPVGTNGGKRKKSANELRNTAMRNSNKQRAICSFCLKPSHSAGNSCELVRKLMANFVGRSQVAEFCQRLGNPSLVQVVKPGKEEKEMISKSFSQQATIPPSTRHIVVRRCYESAKTSGTMDMNPVEVNLLGEGGLPLGREYKAVFPRHMVVGWINANCKSTGRKKHLLSSVQSADPLLSQEYYDYSPEKTIPNKISKDGLWGEV